MVDRKAKQPEMKHKPRFKEVRNKFTKGGGVYSWKRLKISLVAGLGLFVVMMMFIGNITVPLVSDIQFWITIGAQNGKGGQFWDYGSPQNFFKIMRPLDPATAVQSGPDFYLFNPIGLVTSYLFLVLVAYFFLTLFSDFNFGKRNIRRPVIALIVVSSLLLVPLAAADWQTIFEQNSYAGGYWMTGAGWYHKQSFTLSAPLTSNRVKYEAYLSKTGSVFYGQYNFKLILPNGYSYEIVNYLNSLQASPHWESVTTSDAQTCPAGTGYIYFGIGSSQPTGTFIYTYGAASDPYSGGIFIYNHGEGEVQMGTVDMSTRAYKEYNPPQVTLTMAVSGSGTTSPTPGTHTYAQGTTVHCVATPNSGWSFSHWSGSYSGSQNPYDIVMNTDKSLTAVFTQNPINYILTMVAGTGGSVSPSAGQHTYAAGTEVTITATAQSGYTFSNWAGTGSGSYTGNGNPVVITMQTNIQQTATFTQNTKTLTMVLGTGGASTTPSAGPHQYAVGTQVQISAIAASGYQFQSWTGSGTNSYSGTENPHTITIGSTNIVETANFIPVASYTLHMTMGSGGASTTPSAGDHTGYHTGDSVTISAVAGSGYTFSSWSGSGSGSYSGSQNSYVIIFQNSDIYETANFQPLITRTLTMAAYPIEGGNTNPSPGTHSYDNGESVICTATAADHWHFSHWSGNYNGNENPYTIIMNSDKMLTANFEEDIYTLSVTTTGQGTIYKYPAPPYYYNDMVELTATPSSGWSFDHWTGDLSGSDNPANIYMTANKAVTAVFTQNALPPTINKFTVNTTSIRKAGNVTFSWATNGAFLVHLYLNEVDQGEFDPTVEAKSIRIEGTTKATITATGDGGDTGSSTITIALGEGQTNPSGFNYNWLLLLIIPVGLVLFDRWLKKKPPFGKKESDYVTINIGDALKTKSTKEKKSTKKQKTRGDKAKETAKKAGSTAKKAFGKIRDILRPKPPSGDTGYSLRIKD